MKASAYEKGTRRVAVLAYFVLGLDATIIQALLIRAFLVAYQGNELCIGIIFGAWFLWVVLGTRMGAWAACRIKRVNVAFYAAVMLGVACVAGQLMLIQLARSVLHVAPGLQIPARTVAWFTVLAMFPFPFLMGGVFPLGTRLFGAAEHDARAIGFAYVGEALGALCGGVVFTLLLAGTLTPFAALWLVLLATGTLGLALWWEIVKAPRRLLAVAVVGCVLAGAVLWSALQLEGLASGLLWKSLGNPGELLKSRRTRFQHVMLARTADQYNLYSNGSYLASFPNPYEMAPASNYVLCEHPDPRSVLVIGQVFAGLAARMLETPGMARLDCVALDRSLALMLAAYLPAEERAALQDARVSVVYADGRSYVKRTKRRYDIIYIWMPDPSNAFLNRYYTVEFFREAMAILNPGGVLALRISANPNYLGPEMGPYAASVYGSLREVFTYVVHSYGNIIYFFASPSPDVVTDDLEELKSRYLRRSVRTRYFFPESFYTAFQKERVRDTRARLLAQQARVNHDLYPITYFYNFLLWNRVTGAQRSAGPRGSASGSPAGSWLGAVRIVHLLAAVGLLALLWGVSLLLARSPQRRQKLNCVAATGTCGFAAMSLSVLLLLAYENLFGYLYQVIALLTALFMLGLVGGALLTSWLAPEMKHPRKAMAGILLAVAVFAVMLPLALSQFSTGLMTRLPSGLAQGAYMLLLVGTGFLTGMNFPISAKLYAEAGFGSESARATTRRVSAAGALEAADHTGAMLGAVTMGALLVPLAGIRAVCVFLGALCCAAAAMWSLHRGAPPQRSREGNDPAKPRYVN